MVVLKNDSRYNEDQIRDNFNGTNGHTGAHIDAEGVVRWNSNNNIPFAILWTSIIRSIHLHGHNLIIHIE